MPNLKMTSQTTHWPEANQANPGLKFIFSWACHGNSDLFLGAELRKQVLGSEYYFPVF